MAVMVIWALAAALTVVAAVRIRQDGRQLSNVVMALGAVLFAATAVVDGVVDSISLDDRVVIVTIAVLGIGAVLFVAGLYLTGCSGWTLHKEGANPAAILTFGLGLALMSYVVAWALVQLKGADDLRPALLVMLPPLLYLSGLFCAFLIYGSLYGRRMQSYGRKAQFVIVLGAGLIGGRVTPLLASRLDRAIFIYETSRSAGNDPIVIPSGGKGEHSARSEASAMAIYLADQGVPASSIRLEGESHTTEENLRFSKRLLHSLGVEGEGAVVTNSFHAFRAALLMRKVGLRGQAVGSHTVVYFWPSAVVREFTAVMRDHAWLNAAALAVSVVPALWLVGIRRM